MLRPLQSSLLLGATRSRSKLPARVGAVLTLAGGALLMARVTLAAPACPPLEQREVPAPGTSPAQLTLDYWRAQLERSGRWNQQLLSAEERSAHNQALRDPLEGEPRAPHQLTEPPPPERLAEMVAGRLAFLREQLAEVYVDASGAPLGAAARALFEPQPLQLATTELRATLAPLQIRCGPQRNALYKRPEHGDETIDRNACSRLPAQAPVLVLGSWGPDLKLVLSELALGWIPSDAVLSPPLGDAQRAALLGEQVRLAEPLRSGAGQMVPAGARLTVVEGSGEGPSQRLWVANRGGFEEVSRPSTALSDRRPLTRGGLLSALFEQLGRRYGLGGDGGGIDCSRLILDAFRDFGLRLPRYSGHLAEAGLASIDLTEISDERERLALLDAAHQRGQVLLYLPGHVMVYLGRSHEGTPMALHAFADFPRPCASGGETTQVYKRVTVTDLERGRGSSKGAYLQRITKLVLFARELGPGLSALARPRAPGRLQTPLDRRRCRATPNRAKIFHSPAVLNARSPARFLITHPSEAPPAALTLSGPDGAQLTPTLERLGGPPYIWIATVDALPAGRWQAHFGEEGDALACRTIRVRRRPPTPTTAREPVPVWTPEARWDAHSEALYAGFVEKLFQYPLEEDRSWTNLQDLLNVRENNLLFNHLSADEEQPLRLRPDCADLPYTLRAYFAWKLRLPFAFRSCNRGSRRRAPTCEAEFKDSLLERSGSEGERFQWFARRQIAGHIHSASARTLPDDENTDLYPVAFSRAALRPGTVYADPYGHLLLIAGWKAQPQGGYGVLIGADGQPDGTIGRRRFWEGSFLFDPARRLFGAGFKAFRPLVYEAPPPPRRRHRRRRGEAPPSRERRWRLRTNDELSAAQMGALAYSLDQYEVSKRGFYDAMRGLINPRPIDPSARLEALVEALFESARRRVLSVQNAVDYLQRRPRVIPMPRGYSIFETSGPWEDFSTPARDMRLLIAIDTVLDLPDAVARTPARFGLRAEEVPAAQERLRGALQEALSARSFEYQRSDGSSWTLTLAALVERRARMEMAYNPNDCPELRWGADPESDEGRLCRRRAPRAHRARMDRYRPWFQERRRPPRGTRG